MKAQLLLLGSAVALLSACDGAPTTTQMSTGDKTLVNQSTVDFANIRAGMCGPVASQFDANLAKRLTAGQLCGGWVEYLVAFGAFKSAGAPLITHVNNEVLIQEALKMAKMPGEYNITFPGNQIAGLRFLSGG